MGVMDEAITIQKGEGKGLYEDRQLNIGLGSLLTKSSAPSGNFRNMDQGKQHLWGSEQAGVILPSSSSLAPAQWA